MKKIKLFLIHLIKYLLIVLSWILKFAIVIPVIISKLINIEKILKTQIKDEKHNK